MEWIADPTLWVGLATLVVLEIVLGVGLAPQRRERARIIGLTLLLEGGRLEFEKVLREPVALPEGSYRSAAGPVLALLGRLPARGDAVEWGGWQLEIAAMDGLGIERIVARRAQLADAA